MKAGIVSFTKQGHELARRIEEDLRAGNWETDQRVKCRAVSDSMKTSLEEWTKEQFDSKDALIFVGAMGIAVRAVAPFVTSKVSDPAVLVIDDTGRYCIPLLSGHLGGANELAEELAGRFGMEAVITTATDRNGKWAVDVFARKNGLYIRDMGKAKEISARILNGEEILIRVENRKESISNRSIPDVYIGIYEHPEWKQGPLYLIPKTVDLGIGCRRGISEDAVEGFVGKVLDTAGICPESVGTVNTIDRKAKEPALLQFCENRGLSLQTFSPEELKCAKGRFTASGFVQSVTGVDNVCERSAVQAGGGRLLVKKQAGEGVTVALALRDWSVEVEENLCGWYGAGKSRTDDDKSKTDPGKK